MKKSFYPLLCLVAFSLPRLLAAQTSPILEETGRAISEGLRRLPEVVEAWSRALPYESQGPYYNNRAADNFAKGRFQEAADDYTRALTYYPGTERDRLARVHYRRGLCRYILGDYAAADEDFSMAINLRPDVSDSWYFRGKVRLLIYQRRELALADFRQVLATSGNLSVQSAFSRYFMGDRALAREDMSRLLSAVSIYDRDAWARIHYNMAAFYALDGDARSATDYLSTALTYGYDEYEWLRRDINFKPIAGDPAFRELLLRYGLVYAHNAGGAYEPLPSAPAVRSEEPAPVASTSRVMAPAVLEAQAPSFSEENDNLQIDAGESVAISFMLSNRGKGEARNVQLRVREDNRVHGLRFSETLNIGSIAAGETRTFRVPIVGEETLASGEADFTLEITEENGFDASPLHIRIPTQALLPPQLTLSDHHFTSETGGVMRTSVPITLKIAIQNDGQGPARDVKASMHLPQNVFTATDNSAVLGNLEVGESKVAEFQFFTNNRFNSPEVSILIEVTEGSGKYGTTQTVRIGLDQALEVSSRVVITAKPGTRRSYEPVRLSSDIDRNLPLSQTDRPDAVAVVIGVRDYQHPDVPAVEFAHNDAASVKNYLVRSFGFHEENIIYLVNPTQADLNGVFGTQGDHKARLYNLVKPEVSDVFVFYSGHGAPELQTNEAYLVPSDCDPSLVKFNGYALRTLYENLAQIQAKTLTVAIDACFSGMSDRGTLIGQASPVRIKTSNPLLRNPRAVVLSAAASAEVASWLPEESHGLFTYYLLKGIQGAANTDKNRDLSLAELRKYLNEQVPVAARRISNRVQTPDIQGLDNTILLSY
ncbi:MAG: hypothetical protein EAZ89_09160 [Bacteroidetes bacterium]|nr:MAG: hypothetical protein EAZ89_09160 [Bacteroidota bacterium]